MITLLHARHTARLGALASLSALGCYVSSSTPVNSAYAAKAMNNLTFVEIQPVVSQMGTAGDLVRTLRPAMLVPRDRSAVHYAASPDMEHARALHVYVDDILLGGIEVLERIPARSVLNVRSFTPVEAVTRYGGRHNSGVIAVTTIEASPTR